MAEYFKIIWPSKTFDLIKELVELVHKRLWLTDVHLKIRFAISMFEMGESGKTGELGEEG